MRDIVSQFVRQMTLAEKKELLGELKAAIAAEIASSCADPARCPLCGCPLFVRKGRGTDGSQRWLCRRCARTFSARTGSLLALSKLGADAWMAFAECMADAPWFMRMRVCEVMRSRTLPARKGTFHLGGTLVGDSLSGNHGRSPILEMPRGSVATARTAARAGRAAPRS